MSRRRPPPFRFEGHDGYEGHEGYEGNESYSHAIQTEKSKLRKELEIVIDVPLTKGNEQL